ncbi:MAG: hypothetical protein V1921_00590 [Candidatus Altiarchaeota archaeon]
MGLKNDVIREILTENLSENHVSIIKRLKKPSYDEDIATSLKVKATVVRTLLNELHEKSLVEYARSKNKKTGWYTYLWKRRDDKIDDYIRGIMNDKLKILNDQLELEKQAMIFDCACGQVPFEIAMDTNFVCQNCGENFTQSKSKSRIDKIVREIADISSRLEEA